MTDQHGSVGPPTDTTLRNIKQARAHSLWLGPVHVEWKAWTGGVRLLPVWSKQDTEFWNEGPVRWVRVYWLTWGLSVYWALPERRINHVGGWLLPAGERRSYPDGTGQTYPRRTRGD